MGIWTNWLHMVISMIPLNASSPISPIFANKGTWLRLPSIILDTICSVLCGGVWVANVSGGVFVRNFSAGFSSPRFLQYADIIVWSYQCRDVQSLPIDVRQALANLIFAASRCGDLPVLNVLRGFFRERYSCGFQITNVELRHENIVSSQIKQSLGRNVVPDDEKVNLISEIAKEHTLYLCFSDCGQSSNMQSQEVSWLYNKFFFSINLN